MHRLVLDRADGDEPRTGASPIRFEDAVLVRRAREGDATAFTTLASKYQDKVHNACWRLCGNLEDARDLTQEAMFRAYQGLASSGAASFKGESGFYTWLFRIAVNLALSHRRKASHRRAQSLDQPVGWGTQAETLQARMADRSAPDPAAGTLRRELAARIEAALADLEPEHRSVVVLRDMEGMDYAQIAEVLDVAVGTVKSRLHRARAALREQLAPYVEME